MTDPGDQERLPRSNCSYTKSECVTEFTKSSSRTSARDSKAKGLRLSTASDSMEAMMRLPSLHGGYSLDLDSTRLLHEDGHQEGVTVGYTRLGNKPCLHPLLPYWKNQSWWLAFGCARATAVAPITSSPLPWSCCTICPNTFDCGWCVSIHDDLRVPA
jgi:hypothetical protein